MPLNQQEVVKLIVAGVIATSAIVSTSLYVDARYAHAGEVFQLKKDVSTNALEFRNRSLNDEIFRLNIQQQAEPNNPVYPALKERYQAEIRENSQQIQSINQQQRN